MIFTPPKHFNVNHIEEFLEKTECIFSFNNRMIPNVDFHLNKIQKISIIGLLLIYKVLDYSYQNHCFTKPSLTVSDFIEVEWEKYGFTELIRSYISNKDITENAYKKFKIKVDTNFIIAPQPLLRHNQYSKDSLKNIFFPQLEDYYKNNSKAVTMIFTCICEILLNFWEHAVIDTKSIIVADGNNSKIEIACADTGNGIISTLKSNGKYKDFSNIELLSKSIEKGVTSKESTDHMGYGLWIVEQICKLAGGRFHLYSEGCFYKNSFGKIEKGNCGFWKGTIVYINLPLTNPKTLSDVYEVLGENIKHESIKINFI